MSAAVTASYAYAAGILYGALKKATANLVITRCHPDCNHCQETINICHAALAEADNLLLPTVTAQPGQHMDRIIKHGGNPE